MKFTSTLLFLFHLTICQAQIPEGHGLFPTIQYAHIKTITEYRVSYSDSTENDSTFIQKAHFNKDGRISRREIPAYNNRRNYVNYNYNSRGYLTRIDSSGLFGYGYGSIGPDTVYSYVEETWEHYDTTSRIFKRRRSSDSWPGFSETHFFYNSNGKLTEEKTVSVRDEPYEVTQSSVQYMYNELSFIKEINHSFEEKLHYAKVYIYETF